MISHRSIYSPSRQSALLAVIATALVFLVARPPGSRAQDTGSSMGVQEEGHVDGRLCPGWLRETRSQFGGR